MPLLARRNVTSAPKEPHPNIPTRFLAKSSLPPLPPRAWIHAASARKTFAPMADIAPKYRFKRTLGGIFPWRKPSLLQLRTPFPAPSQTLGYFNTQPANTPPPP